MVARSWYQENRERALEQQRGYYEENRDRILERQRRYNLNRLYGISAEDYDALLDKQGGVCAVCGVEPDGRRLAVDHNHQTGLVRGLLCYKCNYGIGSLDDNPVVLRAAADYLERS